MCHHVDEALSLEELQKRRRADEADELRDDSPDVDAIDEPAGDRDETEPAAPPGAPADD